jgi:hypothetical protein
MTFEVEFKKKQIKKGRGLDISQAHSGRKESVSFEFADLPIVIYSKLH